MSGTIRVKIQWLPLEKWDIEHEKMARQNATRDELRFMKMVDSEGFSLEQSTKNAKNLVITVVEVREKTNKEKKGSAKQIAKR